jgi:hypothetical protein
MLVYYARAVDSCDWNEVQASRQRVVDCFAQRGMEVINDFSNGFDSDKELVESQIANIRRCDILVAQLTIPNHPYVGCIGEIIYAHQMGKRVYVVYGENAHIRERPWLSYHTDGFFRTFEELFRELE